VALASSVPPDRGRSRVRVSASTSSGKDILVRELALLVFPDGEANMAGRDRPYYLQYTQYVGTYCMYLQYLYVISPFSPFLAPRGPSLEALGFPSTHVNNAQGQKMPSLYPKHRD